MKYLYVDLHTSASTFVSKDEAYRLKADCKCMASDDVLTYVGEHYLILFISE